MPTLVKVYKKLDMTGQFALGTPAKTTQPWGVVFADMDAVADDAASAAGLPAFGDYIKNLRLTEKNPTRNTLDPREWIVECVYTQPVPGAAMEAAPATLDETDGSRWNVELSINAVPYEVTIFSDIFGNPLTNTAGDPITNVTEQRHDEELVVSFTTNIIPWEGIRLAYGSLGYGCVNVADITLTILGVNRTFKAGEMRFINHSLQYTLDPSGVTYPRLTLRFQIKPMVKDDHGTLISGWIRRVENFGLNRLIMNPTDPNVTTLPILDSASNYITTPVALQTVRDVSGIGPGTILSVGPMPRRTEIEIQGYDSRGSPWIGHVDGPPNLVEVLPFYILQLADIASYLRLGDL